MKRSVRDLIIFIAVLILLSISVNAMAKSAKRAWATRQAKVSAVRHYLADPIPRRFIFPRKSE